MYSLGGKFNPSYDLKGSDRESVAFPVRVVPATMVMQRGYSTTSAEEMFVIGYPPGGMAMGKLLNTCSSRYSAIQLNDILTMLEAKLQGYEYDVQYKAFDDRVMTVTYVFKGKDKNKKTAKVGDIMSPGFCLMHSYSGEVSFEVNLFAKRLICLNGNVTTVDQGRMKKRYTTSLKDLKYIDSCIQSIVEFLEKFGDVVKRFKVLEERPVTLEEYEILASRIVENTSFSKTLVPDAIARAEYEIGKSLDPTVQMDAYHFYQGFNYMLNHSPSMKAQDYEKAKLDFDLQSINVRFRC